MNFGTVEAPKKILKGDVQKSPGHGLLKKCFTSWWTMAHF
jgi:hypothetical protein